MLSLEHRAAFHQPADEEPSGFIQPRQPIELQVQWCAELLQRRRTRPFKAPEVARLEAADNRHLPPAFVESSRKSGHARRLFKFPARSRSVFSDQNRLVTLKFAKCRQFDDGRTDGPHDRVPVTGVGLAVERQRGGFV